MGVACSGTVVGGVFELPESAVVVGFVLRQRESRWERERERGTEMSQESRDTGREGWKAGLV